MKLSFKYFALVVMGALISGCAEEVEDLQPSVGGTVTMKTTISLSEQATTRALTEAGVKTFAAGDQIAVVYEQESGTAKALSVALTDADITNSGKDAAFTVTLSSPKAGGKVRYIYPASMAADDVSTTTPDKDATINYAALNTQNGTFDKIASDLDLSTFDGTMTAQGNLPSTATLENQLTIGKFTIKNTTDADITSAISKLTISDGTNTYTVNPTTALSNFYVAMKPVSSDKTITVTASDGTDNFTKSVTGQTLAVNTMYAVNVTVDRLAASMTLAAVTTSEVGWRIGSDGTAYHPTGVLPFGVTAVAMIAYVGSQTGSTTYNHGLAIALTDATTSSCSWAGTCESAGVSRSLTFNDHKAFLNGIGDTETLITKYGAGYAAYFAKNYGVDVSGFVNSGWFLPSSGQWLKFFEAAGVNVEDWTTWVDAPAPSGGTQADNWTMINDLLSAVGGTVKQDIYWASSAADATNNDAMVVVFSSTYGLTLNHAYKKGFRYVRSFLAF